MNNTSFQPSARLSKGFIYLFFIMLFSVSLSFQSCKSGMAPQDSYSLDQNLIMKTDAISLMKKGAKNFSSMSTEVSEFEARANDLIDYERAKGEKNMKTVQMWELMMDPEQNLMGGFLNRWENEGKLNGTFIKEAAKVVEKNFDKIISLEKKKKKPKM